MTMRVYLMEGALALGLKLSDEQLFKMEHFYHMLMEKNRYMNLTAITGEREAANKHFTDSLSIVMCRELRGREKVIDVGTGAGFPGIPLKIAFPDIRLTLLDSLKKRTLFLEEVVRDMDLKDVEVIHGRAEDVASDKKYRQAYDLCVSRAVAGLPVLCEYTLPFLKKGGHFFAYKAGNPGEEINEAGRAIKVLGGGELREVCFEIPGTDICRRIIDIKKLGDTPSTYPRKAGTPKKDPLL